MKTLKAKAAIELYLPWPPSVNHYWGERAMGKRVIKYIGAKGKKFREDVKEALTVPMKYHCEKYFTKDTRLAVTVVLVPPDRRRRDVDNSCKALLDALEHAGAYPDDSQIDRLVILRDPEVIKAPGEVKVTIQAIED